MSTYTGRIRCFIIGSMIILPKTVCIYQMQKKQSEQIPQRLNLEEDKTAIKVLAVDTYDDLIRANSGEIIDHLS